ncbi:MAG TPA: efflux RND transporter periplasmic adaptor subunit [Pyrinomonadaceae bacterium]|jgi:RND family efflux transporter MFP subunit
MFKRNRISVTLLSGLFIILSLLATACGGGSKTANNNANSQSNTGSSVVDVTTVQATSRGVPAFIQSTGSLVAEEQSDIAPQVSGQIVATPVNVGAFVGQGDVIARLDDRDARLRLEQAQSNEQQAQSAIRQAELRVGLSPGERFDPNNVPEVRAAQRNYEAAQAQIRNAEAQINNAEAQARLAEDTARRYTNLLRTGDISRVAYNQQQTQAESARAQVNAVREQVNTIRAQASATRQQSEVVINTARQNNQAIVTARASLENARAATALAQKAVNDTIIRAPIAGYIGERPAAVGEYVTPASRIATLVRTNPIKVRIQLPEADAGRVRPGMGVSINVASYADRQFAGQITAINPSLEANTRAFIVEAQVDNSENLLRPNMFATVRIVQPGGGEGVFVPRAAIVADPNTSSSRVFVIEENTARLVVVQIGEEENGMVRITSGLSGGERVATSNVEQLFDGATVRGQ